MEQPVEAATYHAPVTWFAPAPRASVEELRSAARAVHESPLVTTLLEAFGSVVAVLNAERQVLAVNAGLLRFLGVDDAGALLGLRPGEAFHCVHAHDHPGGCGTSRFCSTCGAAIAIVLSQASGAPVERECLLTIDGSSPHALELAVRAAPLELGGRRLVALLLQDIRGEKRRQALERVFFHDLTNTLQGLLGYADLLGVATPDRYPHLARKVGILSDCLAEEVRSQQILTQADSGSYEVCRAPVFVHRTMEEVETTLRENGVSRGRELRTLLPESDVRLWTDPSLVHRTLVNMAKNALEATPPGGVVEHRCEVDDGAVTWKVWNAGAIPDAVAARVFQRYFTTKAESGRGLGTYSMKLFGETYLGGSVWFTTSAREGTTFCLRLSRKGPPEAQARGPGSSRRGADGVAGRRSNAISNSVSGGPTAGTSRDRPRAGPPRRPFVQRLHGGVETLTRQERGEAVSCEPL